VRLLQRTTRSVGLTEAGERFIARLRPAMKGVSDALESLGELRNRPAGVLRLTLPRVAYVQVLAPRLAAFLTAHPDIHVDASIDDALADVVKGGFDAGIRLGEMIDREMIAVRVGPDLRMVVVGSAAYLEEHGKPRHPRELHRHACINYRQQTSGVTYRWEFEEAGRALSVAVDGRLILNDSELLVDAALAGLGLAYVFESSVREALATRRLISVLDPFCTPFPGFFLYYASRAQLSLKLRALVEFYKVGPGRPAAGR